MQSNRLLLRRWNESDLQPFADLNADPDVMKHFPKTLSKDETRSLIERIEQRFEEDKFGLWAVETINSSEFIGFVGLWRPTFDAHFTPCVEIGWRLAKRFWGNGYAPEAALLALKYGFETVGLDEIIAMTATCNRNSMRVMQKIGMTYNTHDNFKHPLLEDGHPLQEHVLYRIRKDEFASAECDRAG
ncbi:MAG TPA: GNAT family N-acetyltransferase [Oculatellaceae cyanobacterium]